MRFAFLFLTHFIFSDLSVFENNGIDTIDYWHILYNNKTIGKFNQNTENPFITIKKVDIKTNDFIKIQYGDDTPGTGISNGVYVLVTKQRKIILINGKGPWNSLEIPLQKIKDIAAKFHQDSLNFYYFERNGRDKFIFNLKLLK